MLQPQFDRLAPKAIATHSSRDPVQLKQFCENWANPRTFFRSSNTASESLPSPSWDVCTGPRSKRLPALVPPMIGPKQCASPNYRPEIMRSKNRTENVIDYAHCVFGVFRTQLTAAGAEPGRSQPKHTRSVNLFTHGFRIIRQIGYDHNF